MRAIVDAVKLEKIPVEIVLVFSNKEDAKGLEFAKNSGLKTAFLSHKNFKQREEFDEEMHKIIAASGAEFVVLAGFMRLLSSNFVNKWHNKIVNIHPSLLPSYKGIHVHERVIKDGVRITGCTVHFVRPDMDSGPIIIQAAVPILPNDKPEDLEERVLNVEHQAYVKALSIIASGEYKIDEEKVILKNYKNENFLINPPSNN